ncbi:MAG: hypothetical protein ACLP29_08890 [Dissulfurispiraceae bacterium]
MQKLLAEGDKMTRQSSEETLEIESKKLVNEIWEKELNGDKSELSIYWENTISGEKSFMTVTRKNKTSIQIHKSSFKGYFSATGPDKEEYQEEIRTKLVLLLN